MKHTIPSEPLGDYLSKLINRRAFVKLLGGAALSGLTAGCITPPKPGIIKVPEGCTVARLPEKTELIMLTDRPPQLETPLYYFREDITPNEAFFVRWHLAGIPTDVDLRTFKLNVGGHVQKILELSVDDLKHQFEPVSIVAVNQCSGNSRSYFSPRVAGGQWLNGAMGNAKWTGARLKDVLHGAGIKGGAVDVSFAGLDEAPLSSTAKFVKSLPAEQCMGDEILIAYRMNDAPLPMLNGFPLRLVVPGWFATYWVKALNHIEVFDTKFHGYWMDKGYRVPNNANGNETPENLAKDTIPINKFTLRSIFVRPEPGEVVKAGQTYPVEGLAFDCGIGISKVEVSVDGGTNWQQAALTTTDFGRYSWRRWRFSWTPERAGTHTLMVKATNLNGDIQSINQWNKSGYMRNVIEHLEVPVSV